MFVVSLFRHSYTGASSCPYFPLRFTNIIDSGSYKLRIVIKMHEIFFIILMLSSFRQELYHSGVMNQLENDLHDIMCHTTQNEFAKVTRYVTAH